MARTVAGPERLPNEQIASTSAYLGAFTQVHLQRKREYETKQVSPPPITAFPQFLGVHEDCCYRPCPRCDAGVPAADRDSLWRGPRAEHRYGPPPDQCPDRG